MTVHPNGQIHAQEEKKMHPYPSFLKKFLKKKVNQTEQPVEIADEATIATPQADDPTGEVCTEFREHLHGYLFVYTCLFDAKTQRYDIILIDGGARETWKNLTESEMKTYEDSIFERYKATHIY